MRCAFSVANARARQRPYRWRWIFVSRGGNGLDAVALVEERPKRMASVEDE
jgi:hypothetical protein